MRLKVGSETLKWRSLLALVALVAGLAVVAAACGGDDEAAPPAEPAPRPAPPSRGRNRSRLPSRGAGRDWRGAGRSPRNRRRKQHPGIRCLRPRTGEAATGEPIKIGAIVTNVPGIDFTWIGGMAGAYFECVNDNGGISGARSSSSWKRSRSTRSRSRRSPRS